MHKGFTLAEVLITLGIIGVVAAMTIPTLIANTHKRQYTTALKKAISTLSNAARMSEAQFGYDFAGINQHCDANSGSDHPETKQSACAILNGTLKGAQFHYGLDKFNGYTITSRFYNNLPSFTAYPNALPIYTLPDGTLVILSHVMGNQACGNRESIYKDENGNTFGTACYGLIDVNGVSKPNKEVLCAKGGNSYHVQNAGNCIVDNKTMGDIFPVTFYNNTVEPNSSAAWYVFRNAK